MEGKLKKWTNLLSGWKDRYFVLTDDILTYYYEKGGKKIGKVHLGISSIILIPQDPLRIIINTGTSEMHIRTEDLNKKIKWVNALRFGQELSLQYREVVDVQKEVDKDKNLSDEIRQYFKDSSQQKLNDQLADIWSTQAQLQEKISNIMPQAGNQKDELNDIDDILAQIKGITTDIVIGLEDEKKRLYDLVKDQNTDENNDNNQNNTQYLSFLDQSIQIEQKKVQNKQPQIMISCPLIQKLINKNKVFQDFQITNEPERFDLPYKKDPNAKLNLFQILKDAIGKDLTRFAVPVQLNEPISFLQRLGEAFEYSEILDQANQQSCQFLRLAYAMAFSFSVNSCVIDRGQKPFNPLLGETWELVNDKFKFISEQVSHHPPISACYCYNKHWKYSYNSDVKTKFWGKSLEVLPLGQKNIHLLKYGDHIVFSAPKTIVQNIIIGKIYVDFYGEQLHCNRTTGDVGILNLKQRGWNDKYIYECNGHIEDAQGNKKYLIDAKWNSYFDIINCRTQEKTRLWTRNQMLQGCEWFYHFPKFTLQTNHIYKDLLMKIPATDSRLRPDQRALELGNFELATTEKLRLEEKQRAKRRLNENMGVQHVPRWFKESLDPVSGLKEYEYKGGYFEARDQGKYGDVMDLF